MKKIALALVIMVLSSVQLSAKKMPQLISHEKIAYYSVDSLKAMWKESKISKFIIPVNYDVEVYQIKYYTSWHNGERIMASGLFFRPVEAPPAALISYNHGTRISKKNIDETRKLGGEEFISLAFATDGYAISMPDYVGLGLGDKFHLYQIAESEAIAGVDMLRSVKQLSRQIDLKLTEQLFITGYSQGGHATLATHQMIQEKYSHEFTVTASSPMSGAYDMSGVQSEVMFIPYSHPGYLPYLMHSINEVYDIYDDVWAAFKSPYDTLLPPLLDGNHGMGDLNRVMPDVPIQAIRQEYVDQFINDTNFIVTQKIAENNVYDWKPESPVQLCYCNADEQVYYKNAIVAHKAMKENGAERVILRQGGKKYGHNKCALFTSIYTKFWFDSFRKGKKKGKKGPHFKRFLVTMSKMKIKP